MRINIRILAGCVLFLQLASCRQANERASASVPEGMIRLELGKYGKPFAINVPDTSVNRLSIVEDVSGALLIRVGRNFAISIAEQPADLELRKRDLRDDEINKLKAFIVEQPDALVWESQITQPEFHFVVNTRAGKSEYCFEDIRDTESGPFGKEAVMKMYESGKSVQETVAAAGT